MLYFRLFVLLAALTFALPAAAQGCGDLGVIKYNADYDLYQGCTKRGWAAFHSPADFCPTSGLIGHWMFNESGNVSTADDSVGTNDGTLTNFPADPSANWVAGKLGNALDFDGGDDYVEVPQSIASGPPFTVSSWIRADQTAQAKGDEMGLWAHALDDDLTFSWWRARIQQDNKIFAGCRNGGTWFDTISDTSILANTWYHVAYVEVSSTERHLYVNGVLEDTNTTSCVPASVASHEFHIGWNQNGTQDRFDGLIDDVRIYNVALPQADIDALYNGGAGCQ